MSKGGRWIQAVHDMLRDGLVDPGNELREDDDDSTCRPVGIRRSGKCLLISFNAKIAFKAKDDPICIKDRLFPLFRDAEGVARMCDYWILSEQGDDDPVLYVLLCELKSGKPNDAIPQLENARLLAEYFLRMVGHHQRLGEPNAQYRGLVFTPHAPKASLRPAKTAYTTSRGRLPMQVAVLGDGAPYWVSTLCS